MPVRIRNACCRAENDITVERFFFFSELDPTPSSLLPLILLARLVRTPHVINICFTFT
jgi:hypothetical protein